MKKMVTLSVMLLCAFALFAQEQEAGENGQLAEEVRQLTEDVRRLSEEVGRLGGNGRLPLNFSVWGKAEWAPFVYRGDIDNPDESVKGGPGFGVGSGPSWDGIGAVLGFDMWGSGAQDRIGFALKMRAASGDGNIYSPDNTAYIWAKPFGDILNLRLGRFTWDELDDRIYQWEQDIFQNLSSHTFGALFMVSPPPAVPDALKGLMLFSCWGVSGTLDSNSNVFAANTTKGLKYILSSPQAGVVWRHDAFGMARFQFIPKYYIYGDGQDWYSQRTNINYGTSVPSLYWFPARARESPRFELAANITGIPHFFIDMGFGFSLPVTVVTDDHGAKQPVGPSIADRGYRAPLGGLGSSTRIADSEGDVWQPPMKAALKAEFYPPSADGLGFRFRGKVEFGEKIVFEDGSDDFISGAKMEFGLETWKSFLHNYTALFGASLRPFQNDTFKGKKSPGFASYNDAAISSLNHNGALDMGLWASVSKSFAWNGSIMLGISANIPLGGDRYNWSDDSYPEASVARHFSSDTTETYKKGKMVIMIPITIELSLY